MGRESECNCNWNGVPSAAKALLESSELILRGGIRRRIPFDAMHGVRAVGAELSFSVQQERVTLSFPTSIAEAWAKRILSPPVSLSSKLGIRKDSAVLLYAGANTEELQNALAIAKPGAWTSCDLAVAEVTTEDELDDVLSTATKELKHEIPLWIIYRKGKGQLVDETLVRKTARALGWIDTKVVSVSSVWTGLRFSKTSKP